MIKKILFISSTIGVVVGFGYLMYKKGRIDEINEICHIVNEHEEYVFSFHTRKFKNMRISMAKV